MWRLSHLLKKRTSYTTAMESRSRMMELSTFAVGLLLILVGLPAHGPLQTDAICFPADLTMAPNYTNEAYSGLWYEVGNIFGDDTVIIVNCTCSTSEFTFIDPVYGNGTANSTCRLYSTSAQTTASVVPLVEVGVPGEFLQVNSVGVGIYVDYNVIWLDEDSAILAAQLRECENDINYGVHFFSRTVTIDPLKLQEMKNYVEQVGVNVLNKSYVDMIHEGCWQ